MIVVIHKSVLIEPPGGFEGIVAANPVAANSDTESITIDTEKFDIDSLHFRLDSTNLKLKSENFSVEGGKIDISGSNTSVSGIKVSILAPTMVEVIAPIIRLVGTVVISGDIVFE